MEGTGERKLLNLFIKEMRRIPVLTREQETILIGQLGQGSHEAMSHLIEANLRIAVKITLTLWRPGYPLTDMVSGACMGLIDAAKHFKPGMGVRFVTYAFPAIRRKVLRVIIDSHRHVHESLDAGVFDDESETLLDGLVSDANTPEEDAETHDVSWYLSRLSDRERYIIEQRFWKDQDLKDVGVLLGLSKERIRQIEIRALIKLRRILEETGISWQKPA